MPFELSVVKGQCCSIVFNMHEINAFSSLALVISVEIEIKSKKLSSALATHYVKF